MKEVKEMNYLTVKKEMKEAKDGEEGKLFSHLHGVILDILNVDSFSFVQNHKR